jgi:hypothetical protein
MKNNYVPINKMSKKMQKAYYATKRKGWGDVNPQTKIVESKLKYKRNSSDYIIYD